MLRENDMANCCQLKIKIYIIRSNKNKYIYIYIYICKTTSKYIEQFVS